MEATFQQQSDNKSGVLTAISRALRTFGELPLEGTGALAQVWTTKALILRVSYEPQRPEDCQMWSMLTPSAGLDAGIGARRLGNCPSDQGEIHLLLIS